MTDLRSRSSILASEMGKLARGKSKKLSDEERQRRSKAMMKLNVKRQQRKEAAARAKNGG